MPIKKSELYSSIWKSCDELRGGMDASQYKDYVLVLLFMKYVSDKAAGDRGYVLEVPAGGSFADMVALKGDVEIGDKINKVIARLADANDLRGVIDVADFNDADKLGRGKEMVDRLSHLVAIFDTPALDFRGNRAEGDDLLGDAYEYLMRHFATESGKSKGQFYTPAEVSRIMARVIGAGSARSARQTIYDPTCGSGSLLLKAHDEARHRTGLDLALYGQEKDNATTALAKMNLILHECATSAQEIWNGNTLASPHFKESDGRLKTFDFVVANPPFSDKAWSNGLIAAEDEYRRFEFGVPPRKNGDYAYLLHVLASLKSTGKGAIVLPHGVLFRGNAEAAIRREIVGRGYVKGIIGLPANLFYGTGIPACILVLDKENAHARRGIFMVDASQGFVKDGAKNRLRERDIHRIVDVFNNQVEAPGFSRMVGLAEIEANDFNLNLPRYIDSSEPEDLQDIEAHLSGGIPDRDIDALAHYWDLFPGLKGRLFAGGVRPGYSELQAPAAEVKPIIFADPEFAAYAQLVNEVFARWQADVLPRLKGLAVGSRPRELIEELSEKLLRAFGGVGLIDRYDVFQHLMTYWAETMQDDVYLIAADGWRASLELVPAAMVIARYFAAERDAIPTLEAEREAIVRQIQELDEEHGAEDGLLAEVRNEKGKISIAAIKARMEEIFDDPEAADELAVLREYLDLMGREVDASRRVREARKALDARVATKYKALGEDEVKALVVDDKWLAALAEGVQRELDRVSQALAGRVKQLAERYSSPLPHLVQEVEALSARADGHLQRMGFAWQ